jgi:foldase protein PrsA
MRIRLLVLAGTVAMGASACGDLFEPAAAVVGGEKIPTSTIGDQIERCEGTEGFRQLAQQGEVQAVKRQLGQQFLSVLIRREVLRPAAEDLGVSVSDGELDERIEEIRGEFPTEQDFFRALEERCIDQPQLNDLIFDQLLQEKMRDKVIADAAPPESELRDYYDSNTGEFRETRAQHILVKKESLAQDIYEQLTAAKKGEVDELFASLAAKHSTDVTNKDQAGKLGWFGPGDFVRPFEKAANELDVGEISKPVSSQFGVHVIQVTGRRLRSFEAVRDQIEQKIAGADQEKIWQDWLSERFESADVEVNPRYGEFDLASQQVTDVTAQQVPGAATPSQAPAGAEVGN